MKVSSALKQLGSGAAAVYAIGFLVVRARLSTLGAWSGVPLVDANYLAEGAAFATVTLWTVMRPIAWSTLLLMALGWLARGQAVRPRARVVFAKLQQATPFLQLGATVCLVSTALLRTAPLLYETDLLLDPGRPATVGSLVPGHATGYGETVLWTIGAAALWWWLRRKPLLPAPFHYCLALLFSTLIIVILPVAFSLRVRNRELPLAELTLASQNTPSRGLLLLETDRQLVFYQCHPPRVRTVIREDVQNIDVLHHVPVPQHAQRPAAASRRALCADIPPTASPLPAANP